MLQQHKTKEIDFHNKLNELQSKIEDFEVIDIDEYMYEKRVKTYCKDCGKEKNYNKDFCKICNNLRFKSKINYGIFTSGWISASLGCSFYFPTASMLSFGLCSGTLLSLTYQAYNSFI
jgi:hypothetical protein